MAAIAAICALLWRGRGAHARLGLLAVLLLTLSGCLIESQPQPAPPPTATPTPRPTPTATAASLRVDRPPPAVATPPTVTRPTVARPTPSELRGAGRLLYLGKLNERQGIIAVDADGTNRRLLVAGSYEAPIWSPDGTRFAAYGATTPGNLPDQLAIFNPEGRPLARFPFTGVIAAPPAWSPDSRTLLCLFFPLSVDPRIAPPQALLVDDNGPREIALGPRAIPWRWTPGGRVAFRAPAPNQRGNDLLSSAVWSIDPTEETPRLEATGSFVPVGWSPDGNTLYAIGAPRTVDQTGMPADLFSPSSLLAFDARTGEQRVVITADLMTARLAADRPIGAGVRWFADGAVAPTTGEIALWLRSVKPAITPTTLDDSETTVVVIDRSGLPRFAERLRGTLGAVAFWSPDGRRLAFPVPSNFGFDLHIIGPGADPPLVYPLSLAWSFGALPPAWSPDGHWIAFPGPSGLEIGNGMLSEPGVPLVGDGQAPAWQPAVRP